MVRFWYSLVLCLGVVLAVAPRVGAGAPLSYTVHIDAPAELATLLRQNLPLLTERNDPDMDKALLAALVRETPSSALALLETAGYFGAKVTIAASAPGEYTIKVTPGEPVLIDDVVISLIGPIRQDAHYQQRFAAALEAWPLPIGANYRQDEWDDGKKTVLRLIMSDRFALAKLVFSRAEINPETKRAKLELTVDSGPPLAFGRLIIQGLERYPARIVQGMADFQPGSPYKLQKLYNYQLALEQSPHFSSAIVSADLDHIEHGQVPVLVQLTELPRQKLEFGVGYSTDVGAGVRMGYDHYNIFHRGYTGSILWDWTQLKQVLSFGLGFPRLSDNYSHSVTLAYKKTELNNVLTTELSAGAWRIRSHGKIEARLGLEYLSNNQQIIGQSAVLTHALMPSFGWARRAVDDIKRPRSGTLIDVKLSSTVKAAFSSTSLIRAYGRGAIYWTPFASKWGTWIMRGEAGQVFASDPNQVPSSLLFLAGGASSVRGYDYQSLGVPGPKGSILGGQVLLTTSVEYQLPVARQWAIALFRDTGNAASQWEGFAMKSANGVGLRWLTPIAPLSFDIAKGDRLSWYISLGLAF